MTRTLENTNAGTEPVPISSGEFMAAAKTGCRRCNGYGRIVVTPPGGKRVWRVCDCTVPLVRGRADIMVHNGALCWAPKVPN